MRYELITKSYESYFNTKPIIAIGIIPRQNKNGHVAMSIFILVEC